MMAEHRIHAHDAAGWRAHAEPLAAFVDAHLPNRRDVWGGYIALDDRDTWGNVTTAPARSKPSAIMRPRPWAPPVTSAVFPVRSNSPVIP